jgi:amidophosphoribosyltransferase
VRGTTSKEIVMMAREAGANKVYFASAAPPVRFPHVYGIDMPTRAELIATGRNDAQVAQEISADAVFYQELDALVQAVADASEGRIHDFETSCFSGDYVTGDVDAAYLDEMENRRASPLSKEGDGGSRVLDLNIGVAEQNLI